jgi:hypothetical protein
VISKMILSPQRPLCQVHVRWSKIYTVDGRTTFLATAVLMISCRDSGPSMCPCGRGMCNRKRQDQSYRSIRASPVARPTWTQILSDLVSLGRAANSKLDVSSPLDHLGRVVPAARRILAGQGHFLFFLHLKKCPIV